MTDSERGSPFKLSRAEALFQIARRSRSSSLQQHDDVGCDKYAASLPCWLRNPQELQERKTRDKA